ncbi:MAG: hypothetical protein LCH36_10270 [Actinobacteria bacterium]|nr:hypothetical protein [Actinomycetota bacterium]
MSTNPDWITIQSTAPKLHKPGYFIDEHGTKSTHHSLEVGEITLLQGRPIDWVIFARKLEQEAASYCTPDELLPLAAYPGKQVSQLQVDALEVLHDSAQVLERSRAVRAPAARIAASVRKLARAMTDRPDLYREAAAQELMLIGVRVLEILEVFGRGRGFDSDRTGS